MMKILALDLSSSTGWSYLVDGKLDSYGLIEHPVEDFNVNDYPDHSPLYPWNIIDTANKIAGRSFSFNGQQDTRLHRH